MPDLTQDSKIAASSGQISTQLDDEAIVLDLETGTYYGLAHVGARIWASLQQPTTCAQIVETLLDEYDVERATLAEDVLTFVRDLRANRLVELL